MACQFWIDLSGLGIFEDESEIRFTWVPAVRAAGLFHETLDTLNLEVVESWPVGSSGIVGGILARRQTLSNELLTVLERTN